MLNVISNKLAQGLLRKVGNTEYDVEVYTYGFELIISTFLGLISIVLVSLIQFDLKTGLLFIYIFVPLRLFTGGYHAKTYGKCFVLSNLSFLLVVFVKNNIWMMGTKRVWICLLVIVSICIAKRAPVISLEQQIEATKQQRSKVCARYILALDLLLVLYFSTRDKQNMCLVILTICLVSALMLITDIKIKKEDV